MKSKRSGGATLTPEEMEQFVALLKKEYINVFARSYDDMPEIDPEIAQNPDIPRR